MIDTEMRVVSSLIMDGLIARVTTDDDAIVVECRQSVDADTVHAIRTVISRGWPGCATVFACSEGEQAS